MSPENELLTPREAAKRLIYPYVTRGDSLESLRASLMGTSCDLYSASIAGSIIHGHAMRNPDGTYDTSGMKILRRATTNQIAVSEVNGVEVNEIFPLKELYDEIKRDNDPTVPVQGRLF